MTLQAPAKRNTNDYSIASDEGANANVRRMNNRLSRPERRALQRQDDMFLSQPLQMGGDPRSMAAHVRYVVRALRSPTAKSPSSDAIAHVLALHDRTVPKSAEKLLACRKGCSHCCSQMVVVTAPEAFYVAREIRKRPEMAEAVREVATQTATLTLDERLGRNIFCPMLKDAICSIYATRPLGCRGFVSTNLDACLAAFVRGETPDIPMPNDSISVLYACRMLLLAGLRLAGLRDGVYEMNSAVAVALSAPDAEGQWLAGKDLFAGLQATPPPPPQFEHSIRQMMNFVAPTL